MSPRNLTTNQNLKPCPFCSGIASWCKDVGEPHDCHMIVCSGCGISVDFSDSPDTDTVQELRQIMADKWNLRV